MVKKIVIIVVLALQPVLWAEKPNQEGRAWLVIGEMALTFGFYDWAIPTALELHDRQAVGVGMVVAGLGFGVPFFATQNARVSYGQANLAFHGGAFGIAHGLLMDGFIEIDSHHEVIPLAASLAENLGGYAVAGLTNMSAGNSQLIANFGYFGMGYGLSLPVFMSSSEQTTDSHLWTGMPLAGSLAGMASAAAFGKNTRFSYGDAIMQLNLGYLGTGWGVDLYSWILPSDGQWREWDGKLLYASGLLGNIGGLYLAHRLVRDHHLSGGDGWMLFAATYGGGAFAAGLAYLFGPKDIDATYGRVISTVGLVGASATFAITYRALIGKNENHSRIEGQLNPYGLVGLTFSLLRHKDYAGGPIISINF